MMQIDVSIRNTATDDAMQMDVVFCSSGIAADLYCSQYITLKQLDVSVFTCQLLVSHVNAMTGGHLQGKYGILSFIDVGYTTSYVLNSGVTEPNLTSNST